MKCRSRGHTRHEATRSPPSRGAWIEIFEAADSVYILESPPSRGAWIEIDIDHLLTFIFTVAPLAGGVD